MNRAPFVVALIALLGLGITAVLWLNTLTDEAGMRTSTAKSKTTDLRLTIEALQRDVAMLDATPRIADQAKALGMVQAGDSAMLIVDGSGTGSVIGEPSAVAPRLRRPRRPSRRRTRPRAAADPAAQPSQRPSRRPPPRPGRPADRPPPDPAAQPDPAAAAAAVTPPAEQPPQPDPAAAARPQAASRSGCRRAAAAAARAGGRARPQPGAGQ